MDIFDIRSLRSAVRYPLLGVSKFNTMTLISEATQQRYEKKVSESLSTLQMDFDVVSLLKQSADVVRSGDTL